MRQVLVQQQEESLLPVVEVDMVLPALVVMASLEGPAEVLVVPDLQHMPVVLGYRGKEMPVALQTLQELIPQEEPEEEEPVQLA
jgi:hypothetical protein